MRFICNGCEDCVFEQSLSEQSDPRIVWHLFTLLVPNCPLNTLSDKCPRWQIVLFREAVRKKKGNSHVARPPPTPNGNFSTVFVCSKKINFHSAHPMDGPSL